MKNNNDSFESDDLNDENQTVSDKDSTKVPRFKEYSALTDNFFSSNQKKADPVPAKKRTYRIILTDAGTSDGYYLEFAKDIPIQEYASLLEEFFGLEININYDDKDDISAQKNTLIFENVNDLIDFLNDPKEDDE
jgi:hypothetical protein